MENKFLKNHISDSLALLTVTIPPFTLFEVGGKDIIKPIVSNTRLENIVNDYVIPLSDMASLSAKGSALICTFAGLSKAYSWLRDKGMHALKIESEKTKGLYDIIFPIPFNLVALPGMYYAAGVRDIRELATATFFGTAIGTLCGWPMGYMIDAYKDCFGLKENERLSYPSLLKKQKPFTKRLAAIGAMAASIAIVAGIYYSTPDTSISDYFSDKTTEINR